SVIDARRFIRARMAAIGFCLAIGGSAALVALACLYFPAEIARRFEVIAVAFGAEQGAPAAAFLIRTLPGGALVLVALSLATAGLLALATRRDAPGLRGNLIPAARWGLCLLVVGDLLVRAWGINPVFDARYLAEPEWVAHTRSDSNARFYVGG